MWLVRRLVASVAIIFAVVHVSSFILIHVAARKACTGEPGETADPVECARRAREFALDRPLPEQYPALPGRAGAGRLRLFVLAAPPVREALADTIPFTLQLAGAALLLDFLLGLGLGHLSGRPRQSPAGPHHREFHAVHLFLAHVLAGVAVAARLRREARVVSPLVGRAIRFSARSSIRRTACFDRLWHLALPAATLGLVGAAGTARFQRAAMLEVAKSDYVRTAARQGRPERRVVLRHQLRNALLSFITRFGLAFPFLLTGAVLIETVFAWPGNGAARIRCHPGRVTMRSSRRPR